MLEWNNVVFRERCTTKYDDIPLLDFLEYNWISSRRNQSSGDALAVQKYRFLETFKVDHLTLDETSKLWLLYCEHPGWVANTTTERFGTLEAVIRRRFGKLWQTQKATEWVDMSAARLVFIEKITRKLGLSELWNADGALIGPSAFKKAEAFIKKNKHEVTLSFGIAKPSVKKLLNSWGGHDLKIHTRVRKRIQLNECPIPPIDCSVSDFANHLGRDLPEFKRLHGPRLLKKDIRPYLRKLHRVWRSDNAPLRVDASIRKIESPSWKLLRHPGVFS